VKQRSCLVGRDVGVFNFALPFWNTGDCFGDVVGVVGVESGSAEEVYVSLRTGRRHRLFRVGPCDEMLVDCLGMQSGEDEYT
jgi:hypothetical protein